MARETAIIAPEVGQIHHLAESAQEEAEIMNDMDITEEVHMIAKIVTVVTNLMTRRLTEEDRVDRQSPQETAAGAIAKAENSKVLPIGKASSFHT